MLGADVVLAAVVPVDSSLSSSPPQAPDATSTAPTNAATHTLLHLVRPLGFSLEDRYLKRAGLDYWPHVDLVVHDSWAEFTNAMTIVPLLFSARAPRSYVHAPLAGRQPLVLAFGCETRGLPREILRAYSDNVYRVPIFSAHVRSLNLATSVGIVEGVQLLDLCYEEDSKAQVDFNIVMTGDGKLVEVQGTAEHDPFTRHEMDALIVLAASGITHLLEAQTAALAG